MIEHLQWIVPGCVAAFLIGYLIGYHIGPRLPRKLRCLMGDHAPDLICEQGDDMYQRCLYCDKIVTRFERDDNGYIRRTS